MEGAEIAPRKRNLRMVRDLRISFIRVCLPVGYLKISVISEVNV